MPPSTAAVIDKKTSTVSKTAKAKSKEVSFLPQASTSNAGLDRTDAEEIEAAVEGAQDDDEEMEIDPSSLLVPIVAPQAEAAMETDQHPLSFPALSSHHTKQTTQERRIPIPPHRLTPLKKDWVKIYTPLVEECGLQIRMNTKKRSVELKVGPAYPINRLRLIQEQTSKHTPSPANTILQKAADFLAAYALGFQAEDAIALVRMDDLYIESFEVSYPSLLHFAPSVFPFYYRYMQSTH